jgi:hypothetical protein
MGSICPPKRQGQIFARTQSALTSRREVPHYNCTQFSGGMKGREIGGTEISKSS